MKLEQNMLFADRYRLIKCIGRGGFAEVWLADDTLADIQVAVKIYGGMDDEGLKIFVKEINKVYHLNHTNLLKPQHVAAWQGMPYLVMTYCVAGSLEKKIGQITEQEIWKIIHDVASGLDYLHSNNIIHQDIKPANILQDDMGNYVIIDFGISTLARDTLRKSTLMGNTSAGTLAYMGPERFMKDSTPIFASDIWSLGAMLYELLESKTPFPADFGGGMQKAGAEVPDITADVSTSLKSAIYQMLRLNTWERPTAKTLVQWASNPSAIVVDTPKSQPTVKKNLPKASQPSKPKSKRWIWIVLALLILAGLGVLGIREVQRRQIAIAEQEQRYQDSIRQIQIQDSLREVRHQDSIRVEQERIRQDSIEREKKRLERGVHNGHPYIDLGLSVKWATYNIGAKKPEDCGNYYAWGETKTKNYYNWATYKYSETTDEFYYNKITKYTMSSYHNVPPDKKAVLSISDDAAHVVWKGNWRMPTYAELQELRKNCHWKWTTINGVNGYKATSKINGNSIFFPAAGSAPHSSRNQSNTPESVGVQGFYWSKSLRRDYDLGAWNLWFTTKEVSTHGLSITAFRCRGYSIRPVCP